MVDSLKRDWKEDIITNKPENDTDIDYLREVKADIIDEIEQGNNSKEGILKALGRPDSKIEQSIEEMKREGIIENV